MDDGGVEALRYVNQGPIGHFPDIIEFVPDTELMGRLLLRDMVPKMLSHVIGSFALMRHRHLHHLGKCRRPQPCSMAHMQVGSRGRPWYGRHPRNSFP